ncbi:MAG: hypothetical protein M1820_006352 [Bogoriella megaspora]|nr:MAG: hypothetical protein M1820_006352 [Bogoriella megaspora]
MDRHFSQTRRLGEGRYAVVYRTRWREHKCAAKVYGIPKRDTERDNVAQIFDVETRAYQHLAQGDEFAGRIPRLYSSDRDTMIIYLELIDGSSLRNSLHELCFDCLNQMEQSLCKTVEDLHDHGICHGDISLDNIYPPNILLDFSHAHLWSKRTRPRWDRFKRGDFEDLERTFREARALKHSSKAIAFIDSGNYDDYSSHEELASLVSSASPTPTLLEKLKEFRRPTVGLALAIVRLFRRASAERVALDMFQDYSPPNSRDGTDTDARALVKFEAELARSQARFSKTKGLQNYQKAIDTSMKYLGVEDLETIEIRYAYVRLLNDSVGRSEAFSALTALISDLPNSEHVSKTAEVLENYHTRLSESIARQAAFDEEMRLERQEKKRYLEQDDTSPEFTLTDPPEKRLCLRTIDRSKDSDKENENT